MKIKRIISFLEMNGWECTPGFATNMPLVCRKTNAISLEIYESDKKIVLLVGDNDFMNLPLNYYAVIGALIELRQIPCDFISVK